MAKLTDEMVEAGTDVLTHYRDFGYLADWEARELVRDILSAALARVLEPSQPPRVRHEWLDWEG